MDVIHALEAVLGPQFAGQPKTATRSYADAVLGIALDIPVEWEVDGSPGAATHFITRDPGGGHLAALTVSVLSPESTTLDLAVAEVRRGACRHIAKRTGNLCADAHSGLHRIRRNAMIRRRSGLLIPVTLLMITCKPAARELGVSPTATAIPAPTLAQTTTPPPPTVVLPDGSFTRATPVTPDPAHRTQEAALQATIASAQTTAVARATASPFATAVPPIIQIGRPAITTTQRGELSFSLRLPQDTYIAGEAGLAEITLRNHGRDTLFFQDAYAVLLDEQGHEPDPWPWSPMTFPGRSRRGGLGSLTPGGELTHTLRFQVPPIDQATGHTYALWVETQFSRALPGYPEGWDNIWLRIETGALPVKVIAPSPAQQLTADLQVDWKGWRLRVADAVGGVPPGPLWGESEAALPNGAMAGALQYSVDGTWSGSWEGHRLTEGEGQIIMRAWVAAPGYAIAQVIQTAPTNVDVSDIGRRFAAFEAPIRQAFDSPEAAQATINVPIYRSTQLPAGTTSGAVTIETGLPDPTRLFNVRQAFRLPSNAWLELAQMVSQEDHDYAGWGQARYAPEAQLVTIGGTTGYVIRRFGWWALDWKIGNAGFELRAPVSVLSVEELLSIAAGVSSSG